MPSNWKVEWDERALRELKKLGKEAQKRILDYVITRLETDQNPRRFGEPLQANLKGLWRYRVSDWRVICRIEDEKITILILAIGHRREIYKQN